jgi:hypothetical protein
LFGIAGLIFFAILSIFYAQAQKLWFFESEAHLALIGNLEWLIPK